MIRAIKQSRFVKVLSSFAKKRSNPMSVQIDTAPEPEEVPRANKRILDPEIDLDGSISSKKQKVEESARIKRRNYAMMLSYLGRDYYGMQRNPGVKTIEEDLIRALSKADLITQEAFETIQTIHFQRAARTDKGVSATGQVVSLRMPEEVNIDTINEFLPNAIRVFGLRRVTKGFNSKTQCNARSYTYTLPTYAFAPDDPGAVRQQGAITEDIDLEEREKYLSTIDGKPYTDFRMTPELHGRVNSVLKLFEGTHNYHNFTAKVKPLDPRANRYIMEFVCSEPYVSRGIEFVTLRVKGQSFMLHQIRKMTALAIGIVRNLATEETLAEAFKPEKMDIPIVPSLGLVLHHVHYDNYNKRYGGDGLHETLDWTECEEKVMNFHKEYILRHIEDTEIKENSSVEYRCRNGECIPSDKLCDGRANCADGSDETAEVCNRPEIICQEFAFRCNYGACVDGDVRCNGINDCVDKSDEQCGSAVSGNGTCGSDRFRCTNGQCVPRTAICDGTVDCADRSDETSELCGKIDCEPFTFRCAYGACIAESERCNGVPNCGDGSDEDPDLCRGTGVTKPTTTVSTSSQNDPFRRNCPLPSHPSNGRWQLHKSQCRDSNDHCDFRNSDGLRPGSRLVYTCQRGYRVNGPGDVYCGAGGGWSSEPGCEEIRCKPLSSASTTATCSYNNDWASCDVPVLPNTLATVSCRTSYQKDANVLSQQRENVQCNSQGQWVPEPITCVPGPLIVNIYLNGPVPSLQDERSSDCFIVKLAQLPNDRIVLYICHREPENNPPIDIRMGGDEPSGYTVPRASSATAANICDRDSIVCGLVVPNLKPLVVNGTRAKLPEFPWHATIYRAKNAEDPNKEFWCGASIIQSNLLITAAHCVYDQDYQRIEDPNTFFIATGNSFRDYNHKYNIYAKQANVKSIYVNCNYIGIEGNYEGDVAILRIDRHFVFSALLMPVCIDNVRNNDLAVLEVGKFGKVAGFGRTGPGKSRGSSQILQMLEVPYVSNTECHAASAATKSGRFITLDKFCAGYTNGSAVCDGDSGGGLVFLTGGLYYLRGLVSTGISLTLAGGTKTCDFDTYALYTRISSHIEWIQDVLLKVQLYDAYPACRNRSAALRQQNILHF